MSADMSAGALGGESTASPPRPPPHGPPLSPMSMAGISADLFTGMSPRGNPEKDTIKVPKMSLTREDVARIITQAKRQLLDELDLNIQLQAELERVGVITKSLKDTLQPKSLTPHEKINKLLDDIITGPIERFLWFCRTLKDEGQGHLLQIMEVDINQISGQIGPSELPAGSAGSQKQHFHRDIETQELLPISTDALPGILQHSTRSVRMLMRTTLFGLSDEIPLDLVALYISMTAECGTEERNLKSIETSKLFRQGVERHTPNSVLLQGEAGSGKSSFLNDYAHSLCKDLVDCHNKGPDVPCPGHEWKLVVLLEAGDMQGTQEDTIREHLQCDDKFKDQLMTMIREEGQGVLLLNDAADELRKQTERESMRQYTIKCQKTGLPKVLVSSRNGLCHIEPKFFDRFLVLRGFSLEQGVEYMEKYFRVRHKLTQHPILSHVEQHKKEFDWILCNPLRLHIFSELTAVGKLKLEDIPNLSTIKLLKSLDSYVLTRDEERRAPDNAAQHSESFFKLCLTCLLTDERQICESDFSKTSPYLIFLNPKKERGLNAKATTYYTFIHEMFFEFFSVEGLIQYLKTDLPYKKAILLYLCSNVNMRNVLKLTSEYICKEEPDLLPYLIFIAQGCFILQIGKQRCKKTPLTEGLLQLPTKVNDTFPRDILSNGLSAKQTSILDDVEKTVVRAFSEDSDQLQQAGWLLNGFDFIGSDLLSHCTHRKKEEICSQSTHRLLPCTAPANGEDYYMLPMSSTHWAVIILGDNRMSLWCPQDVAPALAILKQQYKRQLIPDSWVYLNYNELACMRGHDAPGGNWSCGAWTSALRELLRQRVCGINILIHDKTDLDKVLEAAQAVITPNHCLTGGISVSHGCVSEDVLYRCVEWARQVSLDVKLAYINIVESKQPEGGCEQEVHLDVQHRVQAVVAGSTIELTDQINYRRARQQ